MIYMSKEKNVVETPNMTTVNIVNTTVVHVRSLWQLRRRRVNSCV